MWSLSIVLWIPHLLPITEFSFTFDRLLDVVHGDKKLFLVFEYLDRDLKKYMDSVPAGGILLSLVKVRRTSFCFSNSNQIY